jgi:hypothetical protein
MSFKNLETANTNPYSQGKAKVVAVVMVRVTHLIMVK